MMIFLRFATGGFEAIREAWKQVCCCLERCGTKVWRCRKSGARKEKVRVRRQRKKTQSSRLGLMSALGARENLAACGRRFFCLFWLIPALAGIKRGFRHLRMATQGSALRTRKPLKRFDRNFISPAGGTRELFLFRSGKRKRDTIRCLFFLVEVTGLEPVTLCL